MWQARRGARREPLGYRRVAPSRSVMLNKVIITCAVTGSTMDAPDSPRKDRMDGCVHSERSDLLTLSEAVLAASVGSMNAPTPCTMVGDKTVIPACMRRPISALVAA